MDHKAVSARALGIALLLSLLSVRAVVADPLAEVHDACEGLALDIRQSVPLPRSGTDWLIDEVVKAAMEQSCVPLIERLSSLVSPSPRERLALLKARRGVVYIPRERLCQEVRMVAEAMPDHPDVLHRLALCAAELLPADLPETEVRSHKIAQLARALEVDPRHHDSLSFLTRFTRPGEDAYGLSDATLARHRIAYYEVARGVNEKLLAALYIYQGIKAGTDLAAAAAATDVQKRVRADLGFDDLPLGDYAVVEALDRLRTDFELEPVDPDFAEDFTHRGPLEWACSEHVFALDLDDVCLSAIETVAEEAAAAGRPLNDAVPNESLDNAFRHLVTSRSSGDAKAAGRARLSAIYHNYPSHLWNYGHYLRLAKLAAGAERLAALRGAVARAQVELSREPYYLRAAGCALARALWETGEIAAARTHYENVAATEPVGDGYDHLPPLCDAAEALRRLAKFPPEPPPSE